VFVASILRCPVLRASGACHFLGPVFVAANFLRHSL
jgi:hypothetical protein